MSDSDRTRLGAADTTEPGPEQTHDESPSGPLREPPKSSSRVPLIVALGVVAAGLGGGVYWMTAEPEKKTVELPPTPPPPLNADALRARARNCLESLVDQPDWDGCEAAVNELLKDNPIDPEGNQIAKRLTAERAAHEAFGKGTHALGFNRTEDAFEELEKIPKDSFYFARAWDLVQRELPNAKKTWAERCKKYATDKKWPQAAVDCGWAVRVACGQMGDEELYPPPVAPPKGWKPRDETVGRFYAARAAADPKATPWRCDKHPLYLEVKAKAVPHDAPVSSGDPAIDKAIALYLGGNVNGAVTALQKIQEKTESSAQHAKARALQRDILAVDGLMKVGQTQLAQGKLEAAAKAFDEALATDAKLGAPSTLRKQMQTEMVEAAYERGHAMMERPENVRSACKVLKLGYRFSKSHIDLLNDVNRCTTAAEAALKSATDCAGLNAAIELSVDGDGLGEKATAKKTELNCP